MAFPKQFERYASVTPIQFLMGIRHENTADSFEKNCKWKEIIVCKIEELGTCMREAAAGI